MSNYHDDVLRMRTAAVLRNPISYRTTVANVYADATNRIALPTWDHKLPRTLILKSETVGDTLYYILNSSRATAANAAVLVLTAGAGEVTYTAVTAGVAGNAITVEHANGAALDVTVVGTAITVTLNTGTTTAADVVTEITTGAGAGAVAARALVTPTATAAGILAVEAVQNLAGGYDADSEAARTVAIAVAATTTPAYRVSLYGDGAEVITLDKEITDVIFGTAAGAIVLEVIASY